MNKLIVILFCLLLASCASRPRLTEKSTDELKLRRVQLAEEISQPVGFRLSGFRPGTEDHDSAMREKRQIEMELLRRWRAGDKEAFLPEFRS